MLLAEKIASEKSHAGQAKAEQGAAVLALAEADPACLAAGSCHAAEAQAKKKLTASERWRPPMWRPTGSKLKHTRLQTMRRKQLWQSGRHLATSRAPITA